MSFLIQSPCQPTISFSPYPISVISPHAKHQHLFCFHHLFLTQTEQETLSKNIIKQNQMAMASTMLSSAAIVSSGRSSHRRRIDVSHINGLNSFGGLKAHNGVSALGLPVCTEHSFAKVVCSLKLPSRGKRGGGGGGGALSSTCNAAGEIFKIAAIINVLVLIGVAVGFVLLRIEASVEESE